MCHLMNCSTMIQWLWIIFNLLDLLVLRGSNGLLRLFVGLERSFKQLCLIIYRCVSCLQATYTEWLRRLFHTWRTSYGCKSYSKNRLKMPKGLSFLFIHLNLEHYISNIFVEIWNSEVLILSLLQKLLHSDLENYEGFQNGGHVIDVLDWMRT